MSNQNTKYPDASSKQNDYLTTVFDISITAFVFAPICIFNWSSTYELFDQVLKCLLTDNNVLIELTSFVIAQSLLFVLYFSQVTLQDLHNRRYSKPDRNSSFYPNGYFLRIVYIYVLLIAYTAQWKSIWSFYGFLFEHIGQSCIFLIPLIGLIVWVFILKNSLRPLTQVIPFTLYPDYNFDNYFQQSTKIVYKKVSTFRLNM
jgi:hypothetical protein